MRLIDVDVLIETIRENAEGNEGWYGDTWAFMQDIENAPTIYVEPAVHCKDCKHFKSETKNTGVCDGGFCRAPVHVAVIDFCSYGERRTDETDRR